MSEKKVCKICNGGILDDTFAQDSKLQYFFHITCLEKVSLLLKIKNSLVLNSVDFQSLQIIFEILYDDIPKDVISNLEKELFPDADKRSKKYEIELDQDKKIAINIISKAFNLSPGEFINLVLKNEIHFIRGCVGTNDSKENLEDYYQFEINIDELERGDFINVRK
ncbi:hypothetical protein LCGC14_0524500 [marine sediment metagenome]|uniref:Uncharacterized protein n=1 Tax=marine sediment metagenome TaxID=412755 RepID=A0A0F9RXI4_9ZZZZ